MWDKLPNHLFISSPKPVINSKFKFIFSTCGIICSFKEKRGEKVVFFLKKKNSKQKDMGDMRNLSRCCGKVTSPVRI